MVLHMDFESKIQSVQIEYNLQKIQSTLMIIKYDPLNSKIKFT